MDGEKWNADGRFVKCKRDPIHYDLLYCKLDSCMRRKEMGIDHSEKDDGAPGKFSSRSADSCLSSNNCKTRKNFLLSTLYNYHVHNSIITIYIGSTYRPSFSSSLTDAAPANGDPNLRTYIVKRFRSGAHCFIHYTPPTGALPGNYGVQRSRVPFRLAFVNAVFYDMTSNDYSKMTSSALECYCDVMMTICFITEPSALRPEVSPFVGVSLYSLSRL